MSGEVEMSDQELAVIGWKAIAAMTPYPVSTLRRQFGKEMLELGIVMKSKLGNWHRPTVWGWPSIIRQYFREKHRMGEL